MSDLETAYQHTLTYLYEQLPMFSNIGKAAIKKDLTNTLKLCEALGNPQAQFKSIHIAGTNGKGSTSHMLAAILQQSGYKTGLYTSPHLIDFRERIRINGSLADKQWVVDFVEKNKALIEEVQPSFFEVTVAMAFTYFAEQKVDVAVIETGLGGRLDSTNIITPILSVITNISYDHKDILGHTLPEIAGEKAGIIKPGIPVLIGEQHPETEKVFFEHAMRNKSTLYYADMWDLVRIKQDSHYQYFKAINRVKKEIYELHTDLLGSYQQHNIKTVLSACDILAAYTQLEIGFDDIQVSLHHVKQLTGLRGRWEYLQQQPIIIADVGHNAAGVQEVMQQWHNIKAIKKHIIIGFVKDKDIREALGYFPEDAVYHFCNANIPRAMPAAELMAIAETVGLTGTSYTTVAAAVMTARQEMHQDDALLITGSFFIVGEAMQALEDNIVPAAK